MTDDQNRSSWDHYWMILAYAASARASCERKRVGAVIVKDGRIISTGYNGQVAGQPHCPGQHVCNKDGRGCQNTIHAEVNALFQSSIQEMRGASIYITMTPCDKCLDYIANCGIKTIYYNEEYRIPTSKEKLDSLGMTMTEVKIDGLETLLHHLYKSKDQNNDS